MRALFQKFTPRFTPRLTPGLRQGALYAAALVFAKAVSILMLPVFTHFLTPEDYGRLDILQTLANLLSIVIGLGMADTLFRFAGGAETPEAGREAAAGIFGLALTAGAAALIAGQIAAPQIAAWLPGGVSETQTRIILAGLSVTGIILVPLAWMRMQGRARGYVVANAGRAGAQAALAAAALAMGFGVDGVLAAGLACAVTLALILGVRQWRETGAHLRLSSLRLHGRFGGVLVMSGAAAFVLDSCGRWFLAGHAGPALLAEYALAAKLGVMAGFLIQPFEMWWLPRRFAVLRESGAEACARMTETGLVIAMLGAVGVSGAGAAAVMWMSPPAYHGAIAYVPALGALSALNMAAAFINTGVLRDGRTTKPIWIDGAAACAAVTGYVTLIPHFGAWGVMWASGFALSLRFGLYLWAGRKLAVPCRWGRLAAPCAICLAVVAACGAAPGWAAPFIIGLAGGILILAVSAFLSLIPAPEVLSWRRAAV